jgi:hypothetical protein
VAVEFRDVPPHRRTLPPVAGSALDLVTQPEDARTVELLTIGASELGKVWTDRDFEANERAFYYACVLEIPTPRWTAYDAKDFGLMTLDPKILMVTQERADTSPIWYTPES